MKNGRHEDEDGTVRWFKDGNLHRTNGPAIEWAAGNKEWYLNGECHRIDGPAIVWINGTKMWYQNNKLHRTDGPAVEFPDGGEVWWILDHFICETKKTQDVTMIKHALQKNVKVWRHIDTFPHRFEYDVIHVCPNDDEDSTISYIFAPIRNGQRDMANLEVYTTSLFNNETVLISDGGRYEFRIYNDKNCIEYIPVYS